MKIFINIIALIVLITATRVHAVSVREAEKLLESDKTVLVDTRRPESFCKAWIPGSINISLSAIKTKKWLQGRKIILLNEGFAGREIEREVRALRKQGFKAEILDGGLIAWKQAGKHIAGDIFAVMDLQKIEAKEALLEKNNLDYLFVDLTSDQGDSVKKIFPSAQCYNNSGELATIIKKRQSQNPLKTIIVLLITEETPPQNIVREFSQAWAIPVFYLNGGMAGLNRFQKNQQALLEPSSQRTKTVGGCRTCPTAAEDKQ